MPTVKPSAEVTTLEAAALLGVSKRRVLQFVADGRLAVARRMPLGGSVVFFFDRGAVVRLSRVERRPGPPAK